VPVGVGVRVDVARDVLVGTGVSVGVGVHVAANERVGVGRGVLVARLAPPILGGVLTTKTAM
jgi:hypothetical protein